MTSSPCFCLIIPLPFPTGGNLDKAFYWALFYYYVLPVPRSIRMIVLPSMRTPCPPALLKPPKTSFIPRFQITCFFTISKEAISNSFFTERNMPSKALSHRKPSTHTLWIARLSRTNGKISDDPKAIVPGHGKILSEVAPQSSLNAERCFFTFSKKTKAGTVLLQLTRRVAMDFMDMSVKHG